jgi:hypothetical protein
LQGRDTEPGTQSRTDGVPISTPINGRCAQAAQASMTASSKIPRIGLA